MITPDILNKEIEERSIIEKALSLAKLAKKNTFISEAQTLYNCVLKIEPENKIAIDELNLIDIEQNKNIKADGQE